MNFILHRTLLAGSSLALFPLQAQESEPEEAGIVSPDPSGRVTIVGNLPDGSEPPPSEPKPRLVFGTDDIVSTRTGDLGERRVTFQKVAPVELPPLPEPVPTAGTDGAPAPSALPGDSRERRFMIIGASAYVSAYAPDQPRSYVQYWPAPGGEPVGLWMNANLLWMTGFAGFEADGTIYSFLMAVSRIDVEGHAEIPARFASEYQGGEMPEFPDEATASFVVTKGNPTEEELAPIRAMLALYNSDKDRLRAAYEGRREAAEEKARELRENPPEKKDIVIRYWRLDEAGQAGTTPRPAVIR